MNALLIILVLTFVGSYGWAMRGTVIGGEKGAMLPGLFIGMTLALIAGGDIARNFWIPAAAGLAGMSFGGIEPYGDTIHMATERSRGKYNPKIGFTGLAVKGALWFSVGLGLIGLSLSAMGGKFSAKEIIIFCVLIPVSQLLGYLIFNTPYKPDEDKHPRIWFSFESREEWGSNAGITVLIIVFSLIKKDILTLVMCLSGIVFGAVGWIVSIIFYRHIMYETCLLGKLSKRFVFESWKTMEFTLGAFGGLGAAVAYLTAKGEFDKVNADIALNGFNPLAGYEKYAIAAMAVFSLALFIINIIEHHWDSTDKKYNSFVMDLIERPFFNVLPLFFILLCSLPAAKLMTLYMVLFALSLKLSFDGLKKNQHNTLFTVIFTVICAAVFILDVVLGGFDAKWIYLGGCLPYIVAEVFRLVYKNKRFTVFSFLKERHIVMGYMIIQAIIITVAAFLI